MKDSELFSRLRELKADNTKPGWEPFLKDYIQSSNCLDNKNIFKTSVPNDQIKNAFDELQTSKEKDYNVEREDTFKKLANGYLWLHRYAMNLCGGFFNIEIARLIKVIFFFSCQYTDRYCKGHRI